MTAKIRLSAAHFLHSLIKIKRSTKATGDSLIRMFVFDKSESIVFDRSNGLSPPHISKKSRHTRKSCMSALFSVIF